MGRGSDRAVRVALVVATVAAMVGAYAFAGPAVPCLAGPDSASTAAAFTAQRAEKRAAAVEALVALADWCTEKKLLATRNELAGAILSIDADHSRAHRWLRHLKRSGEWKPPARPPKVRDRDEEALAELPEMRERLVGAAAAGLFSLLEEFDESLSPGQREALLVEVVSLMPDSEAYRRAHGEVERDGKWLLVETVTARRRRAELRDAARKALAGVGRVDAIPTPDAARRVPLDWIGTWRAGPLSLTATTSERDGRDVLTACAATLPYLAAALERRPAFDETVHMFLLNDLDEAATLVTAYPDARPDAKRTYRKYGAVALRYEGGLEFAAYERSAAWRKEAVVRKRMGRVFLAEFGAVPPWAMSGWKLRLAFDLVGTRLVFTRQESKYANDAGAWMDLGSRDGAGWYVAAATLLERGTVGDLLETLGKDYNRQQATDLVICNAIASYFVEGRPHETTDLLARLGDGDGPEAALGKASNLDLEALRLRLLRWLAERAGAAGDDD